MKLTREEALKYHRQMWGDMQKDIGDTNNAIYRCSYKWEWCLKHFPDVNIDNNCFLCHYDSTEGNGDCRLCPIDWPKDSEGFPSCCVKMNDDPQRVEKERERSKMQKRKFDELISYFNRKVSDMSIDQKYKMELLGMISAIGFAHEKELGTNLAEVGMDCISRRAAIEALMNALNDVGVLDAEDINTVFQMLPPAQPEIIRCRNCKFASGDSRICMKFGHSPIGELDFCAWAERRTDE